MNVAIIPARGGSKRIPRKNIKMFCGKPMIAWSINAARKSGVFDRIIVSTDDMEIAAIARKFGAEVPFMRPEELSDDFTGTIPVIRHAAEWLISQGNKIKYICCIYATAPFIRDEDLKLGLNLIKAKGGDYCFSVTTYSYPIQRALKINENNEITMFDPTQFEMRSQDLVDAWHDAGQFYWGNIDAWIKEKPVFKSQAIPLPLPRERVQDIDTPEDWHFAEVLYRINTIKNEDYI
ncbi:pseudaminic acid cytidylyltransferase [Escherichia coli]|nr:pseudaminic acid cytidylyltransferase [Escherichia coli]MBB0408155.1 pseudaminic acid cytidylyltransferase [Escherichia coli]